MVGDVMLTELSGELPSRAAPVRGILVPGRAAREEKAGDEEQR